MMTELTMIPLIGLCGAEQASQKLNGSLKRKRADSMKSLTAVNPDDIHDLICVGFGPASLAVAVALQDELTGSVKQKFKPKVCFLEQQPEFRWHAGMLLPEAKMQISFLKDLAMLRNPRSYFTFLNYLKVNGRLVQFTNLGTFLPTRLEFADYMKWCSSAFENVVSYGSSVLDIEPVKSKEDIVKYDLLAVKSRNAEGILTIRRTRNVIIAVGGKPQVHPMLPPNHARVIHSSVYASQIPELLKIRDKAYNIGVLGGGQSAAEVFNDLHSRYLNANTHLIFRDTALRPSDDSPFVNEIFDDERITAFYQRPAAVRQKHINADKSTNYSVVRLELLEKIYRDLYQQRILEPDPSLRKRRLHSSTEVVEVIDVPQNKRINVVLRRINHVGPAKFSRETLSLDVLVYATGYVRDAHNELLAESQVINASNSGQWEVQRDYRVKLDRGFVEEDVNIYLQGCNEASHGLSDSLISVLATRAGEVVGSIFGEKLNELEMNEVNAAAESTNEEEIEPRTSSPG